MIIDIQPSTVKSKRFVVTMDNGKRYNFGYLYGKTYIDHKHKGKRLAYLKRHYANEIEKTLIDNLVPSPALFAAYILWGPYDNIPDNVANLNQLWIQKHNQQNES